MTLVLPTGSVLPAAGGLIEIISHLHGLRLTCGIEVETSGGPARLQVVDGTVRMATYRDRAGMTALTAAALLSTGPFRVDPPAASTTDQIGLLTPALLDLLRVTTARVRSDYASKGKALPLDPLLGLPMPEADTTTDELLAEAKLTVRGRDDQTEAIIGDFPDDFLGGLVPQELRGNGDDDGAPVEPSWIPPMVGQVLGKAYLTAEIGVGSSAIVYRALHMSLKIDVAVKVLTPGEDRRSRHINLREAQVLARLNHQNILRVLDCSDADPYPHLVMEYVDGQTFAGMIQQAGRLQPATALGIVLQACEGLAYAASEGVTHNDVKPANLLVSRNHVVKVADLGVARAAFQQAGEESDRAVVGTPAYIAPELVIGGIGKSSQASDIYSLGCTLFHAICGRPPFIDPDPIRLMLQHVQEAPPLASALAQGLDPRLDDLIARMIAKDPADRPGYDGLLAELHRLRATFVEQGAVGPGLARSDVPTAILATLSSAWKTVRMALDKVLRGGGTKDPGGVGETTKSTRLYTKPTGTQRVGKGDGLEPTPAPKPATATVSKAPPAQPSTNRIVKIDAPQVRPANPANDETGHHGGTRPKTRRMIKP